MYVSEYAWSSDTKWRSRNSMVDLKRSNWPIICDWYSVVVILFTARVLHTAAKNFGEK